MIAIDVYGMPAPQGSKAFKGMFMGKDGRPHAKLAESSKRVKPWRQDVEAAARAVMDYGKRPALDGPLIALMVFTMPKPKSAPKTRRSYPCTKPDVSKLCRSTEDALKTGGVWADDARVVRYVNLSKVYPNEDPDALALPGVKIQIWTMAEYIALEQAAGELALVSGGKAA